MDYISKEFGLEFNLNYQKHFEAIYGCTIKNMRKVLNFKIYQIISLFKNTQLTEKGNSIKDAYTELKKNSTLHETFNNFIVNRLTDCTSQNEIQYRNLVNNNNNLYAIDKFYLFENQDMEVSKSNENMKSVFSLNQNNDSFTGFLNINSNNFPSQTPLISKNIL